jgi:hypothetical protein
MARTEGSIHDQGLSDMQAHFPSEGLFPTVLLLCHVVSSDRPAPGLIVAKAVTSQPARRLLVFSRKSTHDGFSFVLCGFNWL